VDYILVRKVEIGRVSDVTVIRTEPTQQQHKLLVGTIQLGECGCRKGKKEVFVSKCKRGS